MAWQQTMVTLLRAFIQDMDETYTYTDERLEEILVASALTVMMEVDFANSYTVSLSNYNITPDPVDSTGEIAFQVLVARKAACIIVSGEAKTTAGKAIAFKDGPSSIDTRDGANITHQLAKDSCEAYTKARTAYLTGDGMSGKGIVTPFNIGFVSGTTSITDRSTRGNWG